MTELDPSQLADLEAIRRLKARYARHLDEKDWEAWRTVFAEDCVLEWPGAGPAEEVVGPDAIIAFLRARIEGRRTSHSFVAPEIDLTGPDSAEGIWAATIVQEGNRSGYGFYRDQYRKIAGDWYLSRYRLDLVWAVT